MHENMNARIGAHVSSIDLKMSAVDSASGCQLFEFDAHLLPEVPIAMALVSLHCGTREETEAGNLDSEHLLKAVMVGRRKPVALRVVRTSSDRPTGYQKPRNIIGLEAGTALRQFQCNTGREEDAHK